MLTKIFIIVSLTSLCFYLYGILTSIVTMEPNLCKMTYMFEYPQFVPNGDWQYKELIITKEQTDVLRMIPNGIKYDQKFVNSYLSILFGSELLKNSSLTGLACTSKKGSQPQPKLNASLVTFIRADKLYDKYGLYAYSEGHFTERARNMDFTGAPVIFVPGNSGSYKQARSLASVALRKGIDNNWYQHLDYFSVDFNDEYSALFGGFLNDQSVYLGLCIRKVLDLYRNKVNRPKKVILIGHSMGGKIAESMLMNKTTSDLINTIISLASPLDQPVINLDFYFESFYRNLETMLSEKRDITFPINNLTNTCDNCNDIGGLNNNIGGDGGNDKKHNKFLNDKLLITIGGGSRDLLIHSGLTTSKYSDVHAMSTAIPKVWLTTDHLCSVWCLQQVIVINRFLYSIIAPTVGSGNSHAVQNHAHGFLEDKSIRLQIANYYFNEETNINNYKQVTIVNDSSDLNDWIEDSRRVFVETFPNGLNHTRFQMIRLIDAPQNEILYVEAINVDADDWIFGCGANEVNSYMRYCVRATSLSHLTKKLPSIIQKRKMFTINLHKIKLKNPQWTHILIRTFATLKKFQLNIDIHGSGERQLEIPMSKWYSYSNIVLLADSGLNTARYTINVTGMDEPHETMELRLIPKSCSKKSESYHSVAKICVPWTKGFNRYHYFTSDTENVPFYIYAPNMKPPGYNTTINPIKIELYLDPDCRYEIHVKNSFSMTMARIVQQYSHWLFAHLLATLFLAIKYQISLTPKNDKFKCSALYTALFKCSPFLIITTSRVFAKIVLWLKALPNPDPFEHSLVISILIHGSAVALLSLVTAALWCGICLSGTIAYKILINFIKLPIPKISNVLVAIIEKFPITIGGALIAIAYASCGGIALICANVVYFILISKMYEDYLEEYVYYTAKLIAKKLFGRNDGDDDNVNKSEDANKKEDNDEEKSDEDKNDQDKHDEENNSDDDNKADNDKENSDVTVEDEVIEKINSDDKDHDGVKTVDKNKNIKIKNIKHKIQEERDSSDDDEQENTSDVEENNETKKLLNDNPKNDDGIIAKRHGEITDVVEYANENNSIVAELTEEQKLDAELERLIQETMDRQRAADLEKEKEILKQRAEYDSIHDALSGIHFHLSLFLLLIMLTILNIPSVLTWANNYNYAQTLRPDPSLIPAVVTLISLSFIWQMNTPKDIYGYRIVASILYMASAICVLYCRENVYRLNAVICVIFIFMAVHQITSPLTEKHIGGGYDYENSPETIEIRKRIQKIKEDFLLNEGSAESNETFENFTKNLNEDINTEVNGEEDSD